MQFVVICAVLILLCVGLHYIIDSIKAEAELSYSHINTHLMCSWSEINPHQWPTGGFSSKKKYHNANITLTFN